jgi:tetratricopeptide (TPR) repeat protein
MWGNYALAVSRCSNVITNERHYYDAYYYRGQAYLGMQQFQRAVNDFTMRLSEDERWDSDVDRSAAYKKRAEAYRKIGRADLAAEDEQKARLPAP